MELLTCLFFLLMTVISCSVCQDQIEIKAELGDNVTLPCKGSENNPVTFVMLTRSDLDPEYVLVYRDDRIDEQIQNPRFKGRTTLQKISSPDGNVSLTLNNVTEEDKGKYECFVESETNGAKTRRKRATSERIILLRVAPPPTPPPPGKQDGDTEEGGNKDDMDTHRNSQSRLILVGAGMIFIVSVVVVAIISRKKKKSMSSPLDEAITIPMT